MRFLKSIHNKCTMYLCIRTLSILSLCVCFLKRKKKRKKKKKRGLRTNPSLIKGMGELREGKNC